MQSHTATIILAAGQFPRKDGIGHRLLAEAGRIVCCDGAVAACRRAFGRFPDVIVGDLDSASPRLLASARAAGCEVVRVAEQETNDLEKALLLCRRRRWRVTAVVGAAGGREDHLISNVFRALAYGVELVTDAGRFVPVDGRRRLRVWKGAAVSVFAPDPTTRMTSRGLVWPLDGIPFPNLYCATLNRASAATIELTTTKPVLVYLAYE